MESKINPERPAWSVTYGGRGKWGNVFEVRHVSGFNGEWFPDRALFRAWVPVGKADWLGKVQENWNFRKCPDTDCSVVRKLSDVMDLVESFEPNSQGHEPASPVS